MYLIIIRDDLGESLWVSHMPTPIDALNRSLGYHKRANPRRTVHDTSVYNINYDQDTYVLYYTVNVPSPEYAISSEELLAHAKEDIEAVLDRIVKSKSVNTLTNDDTGD